MTENAIILAAGTGSRLKPITDHAPKCLTEVNGIPILINTLHNLKTCGTKSVTIVIGYLYQAVKEAVGDSYLNMAISYVYNDIFENTNDMYSLWLARDILKKGALVLEGDIFFRAKTLKRAMDSMVKKSYYLTGKYNGTFNEVLIKTNPQFKVQSIEVLRNNSGPEGDFNFMSTGMLVIREDYGIHFSRWLTEFVKEDRVNVLFDDVLSEHVTEYPLYITEISHREWVEIDTFEDLRRAESIFKTIVKISKE